MTRLSTRKGASTRRTHPTRTTSFASLRKAAVQKRKAPAKKRAAPRKKEAQVPHFEQKIKSFVTYLHTYANQRKKTHGAKDPLVKTLTNMHKEFSRHLQKTNVVNQDFAKALSKVRSKLQKAPKALKENAPKLMKHLKENIRKNVCQFTKTLQATLKPIETEWKKIEKRIQNEVKKAKNQKICFKIAPSIKKKLTAAEREIRNAKKRWDKELTSLGTYGTAQVKRAAKSLKSQMNDILKAVTSCQRLIKTKVKSTTKKAGYTTKQLITPKQAKTLENKWNETKKKIGISKRKASQFLDQLKAVKQF